MLPDWFTFRRVGRVGAYVVDPSPSGLSRGGDSSRGVRRSCRFSVFGSSKEEGRQTGQKCVGFGRFRSVRDRSGGLRRGRDGGVDTGRRGGGGVRDTIHRREVERGPLRREGEGGEGTGQNRGEILKPSPRRPTPEELLLCCRTPCFIRPHFPRHDPVK